MNELQTNETVRDHNVIATEINIIKAHTNKILLSSAIEIGKRLKEAKQLVGHGNWEAWLETEVSYSQRTATNLIRISEEYGTQLLENEIGNQLADLGYTQAVAMLKLDFEERENFMEEHDITSMTTRDLEAAIAEKIAIEKEKDALIISAKKMIEENESLKKQIIETEALQKKIDELQKNKTDPKEVLRLEEQLGKSKDEIKKLKQNLKDAKEATASVEVEVEVIPKEVEIEMDKLRTKLAMSEDTIKFKAIFRTIETLFNDLIVTLEKIKVTDEAVYEKYKEFTNKSLDQLKQ